MVADSSSNVPHRALTKYSKQFDASEMVMPLLDEVLIPVVEVPFYRGLMEAACERRPEAMSDRNRTCRAASP
jgi:hypothetical protein